MLGIHHDIAMLEFYIRSAILQPCASYVLVCINMELLMNMKKESMDIYVCVGIAILPSSIAG